MNYGELGIEINNKIDAKISEKKKCGIHCIPFGRWSASIILDVYNEKIWRVMVPTIEDGDEKVMKVFVKE